MEHDSSLSDLATFKYDMVVGLTQWAVNMVVKDVMLNYQHTGPYIYILIKSPTNTHEPILSSQNYPSNNGPDPFKFSGGHATPQQIAELKAQSFLVAFKVRLGLVNGVPSNLNTFDMVTFAVDGSTDAVFTPQYNDFEITYLDPTTEQFSLYKQQNKQPWQILFNTRLALLDTPPSEYSKLPPAAQTLITSLGDNPFSVERLTLDLTDLAPVSTSSVFVAPTPTPPGKTPLSPADIKMIISLLQNYFLDTYVAYLRKEQLPLLNCVVKVPPGGSTALYQPSGMKLWINPFVPPSTQPVTAQAKCTTLNYICSIGSNPIPTPTTMPWNWVMPHDPTEAPDHSGVIAISSTFLVQWIYNVEVTNPTLPTRLDLQTYFRGIVPRGSGYTYDTWPWPDLTIQSWPDSSPNMIRWHMPMKPNLTFGTSYATKSWDAYLSFDLDTITIKQVLSLIYYTPGQPDQIVLDSTTQDVFQIQITAQTGVLYFKQQPTTYSGATPHTMSEDMWNSAVPGNSPNFIVEGLAGTFEQFQMFTAPAKFNPLIGPGVAFFPGEAAFHFERPRFSDAKDLLVDVTYNQPMA